MLYQRVFIVRTGCIGNAILRQGAWHDLPVDLAYEARALGIAADGPTVGRVADTAADRARDNRLARANLCTEGSIVALDAEERADANLMRRQACRIEGNAHLESPAILAARNRMRRAALAGQAIAYTDANGGDHGEG